MATPVILHAAVLCGRSLPDFWLHQMVFSCKTTTTTKTQALHFCSQLTFNLNFKSKLSINFLNGLSTLKTVFVLAAESTNNIV